MSKEHERWNQLLNPKRERPSKTPPKEVWNPFDSDYSRITFSPPFRRLQDKTQVFPLDKNDFVRTRLTHSIEVSSVGRSLGVKIENRLCRKGVLSVEKKGHIPSILSVAGLTHDIGNPPFGHFGESVIQQFFRHFFSNPLNANVAANLTEQQRADLCNFDGNVQSFRLLAKLNMAEDEFSYNLTYPSLATIVKYPKNSLTGNNKSLGIEFKKFGYFQSDEDRYNNINSELQLNSSRHPLTFILEACDDICYTASDLEDGVDKKIILIKEIKSLLENNKTDKMCEALLKDIDRSEKIKHANDKLVAQNIRIFAQREMIEAVSDAFINNYDKLLDGKLNDELISISDAAVLRGIFETLGKKCFSDVNVLKRELLAKKVLETLLEFFVSAVLHTECYETKSAEGKLYALISSTLKQQLEVSPNSTYDKILLVTDYISGMTDYYALSLYSNIIGIEI